MVARLQLAVMDFSSGVNRKQAITKTRDLRYKQLYSKVTQNWVVNKIREQKHHNYLPSITQEIALMRSLVENCWQATVLADIPINIAPFENSDKKEGIK